MGSLLATFKALARRRKPTCFGVGCVRRHEKPAVVVLRIVGCEQVFNANGQAADTYASGVIDRRSDGWRDAGQTDFADTAGTVLPQDRIGNVEEVNIDIRRISDCGNDVVGEVVVDGVAVTRVVDGLLEQP